MAQAKVKLPNPELNEAQVVITNFLARGNTETRLAEMLGCSIPTISKIYSGKRTSGTVYDMVIAFGKVKQVAVQEYGEMLARDERHAWIVVSLAVVTVFIVYMLTLLFV